MGSRTVVDRPLAVVNAVNTASPVMWRVHVDHLNRPVKMTDAAKAAVWTAVWTPWGAPHSITGTATMDARFPGQWYQLEAGLHYNWHRSYDPSLGRYTQPDPLGFVDGPSVYAYAKNLVLSKIDPTGRQTFPFDPNVPTPFDYDPRVLDPPNNPNHKFPYSFDPQIWLMGYVCSCGLTAGGGIYYQRCLDGALNGTEGRYELGFDISLVGGGSTVTHRFFRPFKK